MTGGAVWQHAHLFGWCSLTATTAGPRWREYSLDCSAKVLNGERTALAGPATGQYVPALLRSQALALPARHCAHGMFQSPSPSVPGSVAPRVLTTWTTSPRLTWL